MWFLRVLLNLHKFLNLASLADRYFRHHRPDAVVLIDYPGFNWWIARRAKAHGIPVFYYAPPQIWAWGSWRIKKMRRFVDHVLCGLPFEAKWFADRGCRAVFVGHPYFDHVQKQKLDAAFLEKHARPHGPLVAILPGSRTQEVAHNLKYFLRAAGLIHTYMPEVRFAVASFKPHQARTARQMVAASGLPVEVHVGKTAELIRLADCCMAVSGSVSLELLSQAKPTVILYYISPVAYWVQARFRKVKYITLVNLLASEDLFPRDLTPYDPNSPDSQRVLFPEYLTCEDQSLNIATHVVGWLTNREERERLVRELNRLRAAVGHGGASRKAAEYIRDVLDRRRVPIPRPHFIPASAVSAGNPPRTRASATTPKAA
jgi:lipid-A-disaccharide synthase